MIEQDGRANSTDSTIEFQTGHHYMFQQYHGDYHSRITTKEFRKGNFLFDKAPGININCPPLYHSDLTIGYYFLAITLSRNNQQSLILEYYEKSLKIGIKSISSNSLHLVSIYAAAGKTYRRMENIQNATEYCQKAVAITNRALSKVTYLVCRIFHSRLSLRLCKSFQ
ncbi:unnamed protein product [Adineta ricciae]|uniref:Uncharacterized protein n=1 Tax=Adineta ricciae TaxID=249248 RepID=A0A815A4N6_ADIRI|nr:unnamed protein product [Adineta ricciae]CAF1252333.1 unnamed protein product [Adineta ricciae]